MLQYKDVEPAGRVRAGGQPAPPLQDQEVPLHPHQVRAGHLAPGRGEGPGHGPQPCGEFPPSRAAFLSASLPDPKLLITKYLFSTSNP